MEPTLADVTFNISDLQLDYTTVPQDTKGTLQMEVIQMVKNTAESNNTNISTRVPVLARSLSVVFRQERWLDQPMYDHLQNESPPDPQRVEFVMSDSNQYITYALENREEFLYNYQTFFRRRPRREIDANHRQCRLGKKCGKVWFGD